MLVFILLPFYIALNFYIWRHSSRWMEACHGVFHRRPFKYTYSAIYILLAASPAIAFFLPLSSVQRTIQITSNFWFAVFAYALMALGMTDAVTAITSAVLSIPKKELLRRRYIALIGGIIICMVASVSIYGYFHAKETKLNHYNVTIEKKVKNKNKMNVVLVSDLHLGYNNGYKRTEEMVKMINKLSPDLVCIAGDIFDNRYDAIDDPEKVAAALKKIKSTYGTFACYGNHDIDEPILAGFTFATSKRPVSDPRMDALLKKGNVTLLLDTSKLINDDFYIIGRLDAEKPGRTAKVRKTPNKLIYGLDKSKPIIVIDHEPISKQLKALAAAGVDLDLSGHTHDGQFFPLNLSTNLIWPNPTGQLAVNKMTSIVTSGLGVFGPAIRVGTDSEIVQIDVSFDSNSKK